MNAVAM